MQAHAVTQGHVGQSVRRSVSRENVLRYNNTPVVQKIAQVYSLSMNDAQQLFDDTKKFLFLCATNPGAKLSPTDVIDNGWHTFILFTEDYAQFCDEHFGRFIHHQPQVEGAVGALHPRVLSQKVNMTIDLATQAFPGLSGNWDVCHSKCGHTCCDN